MGIVRKILLLGCMVWVSICQAQQTHMRAMTLMGTHFEVTVVAEDEPTAAEWIDMAAAEISRIEKLISSWDPCSQTSRVNAEAGLQPVSVDQELFDLIDRSIQLSHITDGAFDISYASLDRIWKFDGSMIEMPAPEKIQASVRRVGFRKIQLDRENRQIFLEEPGMKIGFGAIGKGYAADRAKELLKENGVTAGIINASGDIAAWGHQPDGQPWQVAITNPLNKSKSFGILPVVNGAVVTSGNYEKFVVIDERRYAHIIDPRSGYPAYGILSVSVFAPKAELADALATSIFVMGIESGIDRVDQMPGIECIIVDDVGNLHTSKNIEIENQTK